jgi:PH (Pleckstrin Homology) domain-containing protein
MKARSAALAAASAVVLAGLVLAFGPPRAVWLNAGLRIEYPWTRGAAALGAALGASGLAVLAHRRALRALAAALASAAALAGAGLLLYRLEALDDGLAERRLTGSSRVAWSEVASVRPEGEALVVSSPQARLRIDTGGFTPEQKAGLERTIARRVREAGQRP